MLDAWFGFPDLTNQLVPLVVGENREEYDKSVVSQASNAPDYASNVLFHRDLILLIGKNRSIGVDNGAY